MNFEFQSFGGPAHVDACLIDGLVVHLIALLNYMVILIAERSRSAIKFHRTMEKIDYLDLSKCRWYSPEEIGHSSLVGTSGLKCSRLRIATPSHLMLSIPNVSWDNWLYFNTSKSSLMLSKDTPVPIFERKRRRFDDFYSFPLISDNRKVSSKDRAARVWKDIE